MFKQFSEGLFYIYERASRPKKRELEIKDLRINVSYLMKDGKLYSSPLSFENLSEYSELSYHLKSYNGDRETKKSENSRSTLGQTHEVGKVTRG